MTNALDHVTDLAHFVEASPSSYHAVAEVARRLTAAGFTELSESDAWTGAPTTRRARRSSARNFVIRDGAIIAWIAPASATPTTPFRIVGAHTDSPGFKLKPKPTTGSHGWLQAGVEVYGGPLLNSWLDRELEFAGRLTFADGTTALVRTGAMLRFPQLAVHLDRAVNTDGLTLNPQQHMNPVIGVAAAASRVDSDLIGADPIGADLVARLARLAGREGNAVVGYDIVTADTAAPQVFGLNGELFASGRLDNLSSVHAGLAALLVEDERVDPSPTISVFAAFDHEEVGSATRSGAAGPFLEQVLARIKGAATAEELARSFADSWCLSADAGHAVHPNYPERHDPANRPIVNGGPLLKINANQRYATDAFGAAEWARACRQAGVAYQEFVSNNAVPCGSTIGPITATRLGIRTFDVGIALLSMHSARELCGVEDPAAFADVIAAFLAPVEDASLVE
jgi:aspartyl aminopeptidase